MFIHISQTHENKLDFEKNKKTIIQEFFLPLVECIKKKKKKTCLI